MATTTKSGVTPSQTERPLTSGDLRVLLEDLALTPDERQQYERWLAVTLEHEQQQQEAKQ